MTGSLKGGAIAGAATVLGELQDKTKVIRADEAKYLGCNLHKEADMRIEINKRIMTCRVLLQRMHGFWLGGV